MSTSVPPTPFATQCPAVSTCRSVISEPEQAAAHTAPAASQPSTSLLRSVGVFEELRQTKTYRRATKSGSAVK